MTNLVIMKDQQAVTTSLQVAEVFGKEHKVVLKAIDELKEGVAENSADSFDGVAQNYADLFYEDTYIHPQNKQKYRQIIMNRDGFTLLAMGFTGKKALQFKLQYINAFNEMEKTIKEKSVSIPTTKRGLALLALEASEETNQRVDVIEQEVFDLKENQPLPQGEYSIISSRINKRVYEVADAYSINRSNRKTIGLLFKDINSGVKKISGVGARTQLRAKHYEKVMDFINSWEPSSVTKFELRQTRMVV
ncbi:Rha family transcriptional regulator [Enterococcus faecium]|jgi:Rha family phage regulatory protein|uniref:Rha family transcriptional regulator n=1 Tax=Enterococcus TaxID=1350 RepID=UPI000A34D908|nr:MULTISPECIES: Rha family transcriptional regulator [Enterococcus]EME3570539.1 Rha family transcriptional regulator [Enterococcus faecium]EME8263769.1 Rha family transcriptional regulator [Enterococcus faecium]MBE8747087.1 phage regulatory protein [Enterococcus faecium]MBE8861729.1 phage regulatory protein [Enterococcus faecium]MDE3907003.1 Rha family transcriptional regulator [Enterococcus lactis]